MDDCIFCRIISGEIPAEKLYEDDIFLVFKDISPVAPKHVLFVPKKHYKNILEADAETLGAILSKVSLLVEKLGIKEQGFRLVVNTGEQGGQTVDHLHFHLLGGRQMSWPPG